MSTMSLPASAAPRQSGWFAAAASRVANFLRAAFEVFAEARLQALEAQRRYPFL